MLRSIARVFVVIPLLAGIGMLPALAQQATAAGPRFREAFASISDGHTVKVLQPSVAAGALVVGLPSAAIGALIGAAIPGWKQVGPR